MLTDSFQQMKFQRNVRFRVSIFISYLDAYEQTCSSLFSVSIFSNNVIFLVFHRSFRFIAKTYPIDFNDGTVCSYIDAAVFSVYFFVAFALSLFHLSSFLEERLPSRILFSFTVSLAFLLKLMDCIISVSPFWWRLMCNHYLCNR